VPRPRWVRLYGIVLLGLGALTAADVSASRFARPGVDALVAGGVLAAIVLWLRSNGVALEQQQWCACAASTVPVRVIPSRRPEPGVAPLPSRAVTEALAPVPSAVRARGSGAGYEAPDLTAAARRAALPPPGRGRRPVRRSAQADQSTSRAPAT